VRAFAITGPSQGEVREFPMPMPGSAEAVVKVAYNGICGTDYHIYRGDFLSAPYPLVNGHEFSGIVASVGVGVTDWREGDRVAVDPTTHCGKCYHCLRRMANQCVTWGAIGDTSNGALAEYVLVPARNLYRVEDHETLEEAAFTEPLACVAWGVERLRVLPGSHVLIFGAGPVGALLTAMLHISCSADIVVVDVMEEKLNVVRQFGASAVFVSSPDLEAQLLERANGHRYDIVVDCTGAPPVIQGMFRYAGPAAKIMFFGVASPGAEISIKPFDVYHNDWEILGSMAINYTFQRARDLLAAGRIDVRPLITRTADLDDVADILGRPKTATELKTLIRPTVD